MSRLAFHTSPSDVKSSPTPPEHVDITNQIISDGAYAPQACTTRGTWLQCVLVGSTETEIDPLAEQASKPQCKNEKKARFNCSTHCIQTHSVGYRKSDCLLSSSSSRVGVSKASAFRFVSRTVCSPYQTLNIRRPNVSSRRCTDLEQSSAAYHI